MDMKELYFMTTRRNILEQYQLPHTFFTSPEKALDEETCLHEIIAILVHEKLSFPKDSSDFGEMIDSKSGESISYPKVEIVSKGVETPYVNTMNPLIRLLCFMKAYASHTYKKQGSFRLYFMDVFDAFYSIDIPS
jgi:hypothetical protein